LPPLRRFSNIRLRRERKAPIYRAAALIVVLADVSTPRTTQLPCRAPTRLRQATIAAS